MRCTIRPASPSEAPLLGELALRSKASWGYDDTFMAACRDELMIAPDDVLARPTYVALAGGRIVGFYTLDPENETRVELGHLFVEPEAIGGGLGRELLEHACVQARAGGHDVLVIQSDPHAEPFYTACGARRVGARPSASIPGRILPLLEISLTGERSPRAETR